MEAQHNAGKLDLERCTSSSESRVCLLRTIDRISYADALKLQRELHARVVSRDIPGILLLLEHNPVITMGVKTAQGNILASPQALVDLGIELVKTDRGGDVTYHGPGQLVGYPILRLRELGLDVHQYLRLLEQSIIDALVDFGIAGERNGPAGVWVGDRKICSIGIAVRKWVSYHGFALNVNPDMSHFALINPCGLASHKMTSMLELLGAAPATDDVRDACSRAFAKNFGLRLQPWLGESC